jgi:4-hydroxy-3-polyprenylbenzoate decarboxylase
MKKQRIIVGITGATGTIYGIRLLEMLREQDDVETHLVVSRWGQLTRAYETDMAAEDLVALADYHHAFNDLTAPIASGSFSCDGMIVAPCSIKTLSEIAYCNSTSLLTRAADVILKERKRLVLMVRETPLHAGHLECMLRATQSGAVIAPPVTSFYTRPKSVADIVDHTLARVLDLFGIRIDVPRWDAALARRHDDADDEVVET